MGNKLNCVESKDTLLWLNILVIKYLFFIDLKYNTMNTKKACQ